MKERYEKLLMHSVAFVMFILLISVGILAISWVWSLILRVA